MYLLGCLPPARQWLPLCALWQETIVGFERFIPIFHHQLFVTDIRWMKMPSNLWKLFSLGSTPMRMKFLLVSLLVHAVAAQLPCELFTTSIGHDSIKIQVPEVEIIRVDPFNLKKKIKFLLAIHRIGSRGEGGAAVRPTSQRPSK